MASSANDEERPDSGEKPQLKNFLKILRFGTRWDFALMATAAVCAAATGTALPLMNIVFGKLATEFNAFFVPGSRVTQQEFMQTLNRNVLYIVYLFVGKFVLNYISMLCIRMAALRISARLRLEYTCALFRQPIAFVDKLPIGRPTTTITTSANTIQAGIGDKLSILVQSLTLVIAAYAIAFRYSWSLTLVSTSALVFIMAALSITVPLFLRLQKSVDEADEKASSIAGEVLGSIRTIVACGAEGRVLARYGKWIAEARSRGMRISPLMGVHISPPTFALYCNFALTFWFGVRQYSSGNVKDIGQVIVVIFSVLLVVSSLSNIAAPMIAVSKAITASTAFFEVLDIPRPKVAGLMSPEVSASTDIRFDNVDFFYPSRPNVKVLDNLSLCIPAGKITAFVGPSGCGKSTIVALLERWYQVDDKITPSNTSSEKGESSTWDNGSNKGSIRLGDKDIIDLDLKWWRSQIGLVQQEPFCFNTSIYHNVSYGLIGTEWEGFGEEQKRLLVEEACREAFATEFIEKLPQGYDTPVGESGIKLSGGQRQRLAIARSIIKKPSILILDEATSSIDVRGERIVQEALDRVSRNRTTIMIAHRLSTIKKADKIIVLRSGKAMEEGTHQELLSKDGIYRDLVKNQELEMGEGSAVLEDIEKSPEVALSTEKEPEERVDDTAAMNPSKESCRERSLINSVGLFLFEQRQMWWLYVLVLIGAIGLGASFSAQGLVFAKLVETFQLTGVALLKRANFWALIYFIIALGVLVFYFMLGSASVAVATNVVTTYRQQYFEAMIYKPIPFFDKEDNSAGSLTGRLSSDPTQLQELLGPYMAFPLISLFNIFGCVAISFAFGWKLSLVSIFAAFPIIILAMFARVRYELHFEKLNAAVFAESSQFASEAIGAFRTVTAFTMEDLIATRYSSLLQEHVRAASSKAIHGCLIFAASDSLDLACMALCFWYGGLLLARREYDIVQFFVVYISVVLGGQASGQFGSLTPNMAQATAAANRIISLRPSSDESSDPKHHKTVDLRGGAEIVFQDVSFRYPTRDVDVFRSLSFTIKKGQFVAFVGPSGCGKTSIVSLLERFYDYQNGSIFVNGVELRSLDTVFYRRALALVSQEPTLYQGSIRDNVLLGVDKTDVSDEEVYQACREAEMHDFIESLPEGYNTDVGNRGLSLSGGQKQRLSIARALLRKPQILLLDEATSSLDSASEQQVQASIERTAKGRTVIVVAHRLATVQNADTIFVFGERISHNQELAYNNMDIVESGSHQSLISQRGLYYSMCQAQALTRFAS